MPEKQWYNVKTLAILLVIIVNTGVIAAGCTQQKENTPGQILARFEQLHLALVEHDRAYVNTFDYECSPPARVPVMGAENLFSAYEQWTTTRNDIFSAYPDINFDHSNSRIRDFKNQQLIDILVSLSARMNEINAQIKPSFIDNAECTETTLPSKAEPANPRLKSINCVFHCEDLQNLEIEMQNLSALQLEAIEKAKAKIENIPY